MKKYAPILLIIFFGLGTAVFLWNIRHNNVEHTRSIEASKVDKKTEQDRIFSKSGESTLRNPFLIGSQKNHGKTCPSRSSSLWQCKVIQRRNGSSL